MSRQTELLEIHFSAVWAKLLKSNDNLSALDMKSQVLNVGYEYTKGILIFEVEFIVNASDKNGEIIWQGGGKIVFCVRPEKGTKNTEEGSKVFAAQLEPLLPDQFGRFKTIAMILLAPDGADLTL